MFTTVNNVKEYTNTDVTLDLIKRAQAIIEVLQDQRSHYRISAHLYREEIATCTFGEKFSIFREALRISIPITLPA